VSDRHTAFTPEDVIRYCTLPRTKNVFMLGAGQRRLTIKSQQIRALNLVWALHRLGRLRDKRIAIIGGGFAGLTAAAAAMRLRANVTLFESEHEYLTVQAACSHRRVHPNIFDWPDVDSVTKNAGLPLLNWEADDAGRVAASVLQQWAEFSDNGSLRCSTRVRSIRSTGRIQFDVKARSGDLVPGEENFDVIVVAVGVGLDALANTHHPPTPGYWQNDSLEQYTQTGSRTRRTIVIVGNGDGGVTDTLRAAIGATSFSSVPLLDWVEDTLLPLVPPSLKRDLLELEQGLFLYDDESQASSHLEHRYQELLRDGLQGLGDAITARGRHDTFVRLIARTPSPFSTGATALNRFLLALLIRFDPNRSRFQYIHADGGTHPADEHELRLFRIGPRGVLDDLLDEDMRVALRSMPQHYDAPRLPQYPIDYFAAGPPPPPQPSPSDLGEFFTPLTDRELTQFRTNGVLTPDMRRRGPLGYGHYACRTSLEAKVLGASLLSSGPPVEAHVAKVLLPSLSERQIDWAVMDQNCPPELARERWLAKHNAAPHDSCHGDVVAGGETVHAYCFYEDRIGAQR
jgi:hypothetical protein